MDPCLALVRELIMLPIWYIYNSQVSSKQILNLDKSTALHDRTIERTPSHHQSFPIPPFTPLNLPHQLSWGEANTPRLGQHLCVWFVSILGCLSTQPHPSSIARVPANLTLRATTALNYSRKQWSRSEAGSICKQTT